MTNVRSAITPAAGHAALGQPANREEGPLQSPSNALDAWTQSVAARDQSQRAVNPRSNDATKFCALGALTKASHEQGLSDRWLVELFNLLTLSQVIPANDCKAILASWPFSISSKRGDVSVRCAGGGAPYRAAV
jgi:hypothetical protein